MILMNDFNQEYNFLKPKIGNVLLKTLESGWYILGKEVEKFEKEFAEYTGTKYCISVANGLEALQISLIALGIGEGDEVITVTNTAVATVLAITNTGAKPVFVDINDYGLMDIGRIESLINSKTKVIIPVHLFGQMVDMTSLIKITKKHNLKIIEDACQAHGAMQNRKKAGSIGNLGCFSFYPTKNLGAYGDGGAIVTNSKTLYEKCKKLRNYGQKTRYVHEIKGLNSRLDEIQATILRLKLTYLDSFVIKRNKIANLYLKNLKNVKQIKLPKIMDENYHSFHLFVIEAVNRDKLMSYLSKMEINTLIHYPIPVHKQKAYKEFNHLNLAITEKKARNILSLPINPFLTEKEILRVCIEIKKFYE